MSMDNQRGAALKVYKLVRKEFETKTCFFLYEILSLLLVLLITLKVIDSPDSLTLFSLYFVSKSMLSVCTYNLIDIVNIDL